MTLFMALLLLLLLLGVEVCTSSRAILRPGDIDRCDFPTGFTFGTAAAAYQYEGGASEGGRRPSIWDTFSHTPGTIVDGSNGDVATDAYHKFPEDVQLLKNMGMDAYRFSISWSRFSPGGRINPEGLAYYSAVIDGLIDAGIEPYVTLFHWDLPQTLDDFGGWLNASIVGSFASYAEAAFTAFGDRVRNWVTLNEPFTVSIRGYCQGAHAPGRCTACSKGNSLTEPYIAAHNQLLAHAAVVQLYRRRFQATQAGRIGISLDSKWYEPYSDSLDDLIAVQRSLDYNIGWFLEPLVTGDYPLTMRQELMFRLPEFTSRQSQALRGSMDFFGLNYYTSRYAKDTSSANSSILNAEQDPRVLQLETNINGTAIGTKAASAWLIVTPWGLEKLLKYLSSRYKLPTIIITENGRDEVNDPSLSLEQALQDELRIQYYRDHLRYVKAAISDGVDVSGFFAWSLLDNFEWEIGYTVRFGLHFVDYANEQKRYPKASALWFKSVLASSACRRSGHSLEST